MAERTTRSGSRRKTAGGEPAPAGSSAGTAVGAAPEGGNAPPPTVVMGDNPLNNAQVRTFLKGMCRKLKELAAQSAEINAERRALYEAAEARGLNRHAVRQAFAYEKLSEEQRDGYDRSLDAARSAVGLPIQTALALDVDDNGEGAPTDESAAGNAENGAPEVTH